MKLTGQRPPDWAILLVAQVCADFTRRPPKIQWWTGSGRLSSGHQFGHRRLIHITAGSDLLDQQGTVLHEVCHHICPPSWHHNKAFYRRLLPLYMKWLPEGYDRLVERETKYMKRAGEVAEELSRARTP